MGPSAILRLAVGAGFAASLAYLTFALVQVIRYRPRPVPATPSRPPITLAKPVCGLEPELEENLRSCFRQDYPRYEIVFGVREPDDPALPVIRKVMAEFPGVDATLVVTHGEVPGTNRKVSSLVAICRKARYEILVVADSDIRLEPDALASVASCYEDEGVGAATALTVARPTRDLPSILGAMFLNEEFLPANLVAKALEPLTYCYGPVMSARRSALEAIGGFEQMTHHLADDYLLGNRIAGLGLRVELAGTTGLNVLHEPSLAALFRHELRWARTIRTVRPHGYVGTVVTMATPWALAFLLASGFSPAAWLAPAAAVGLRFAIQLAVRRKFRLAGTPAIWWIPVRDLLSFSVWCASHLGQSVLWRRNQFRVSEDGRLHEEVTRS
ncbi:MAG TPA: bacteriohopanetetrol glucosamine biosynthesis glycosyltransferase HpnI [Thermoanaerobaculia bacterium]|nr:bacteriohopanetetrol glucosamine biosynthesis glycosyltransferase HpnI [Thermoanaerobaculia bacterium]HQR66525.1 bacteriohopanetetrol glucosamine biosynthesis glycosyltransferase HpnI [Thermoanaerobaculia bacterium]